LPGPLAQKVTYTGYIAESQQAAAPSELGVGEVIVAAGGGSVGDKLFEAAADIGEKNWRLLVGGHDRDQRIAALKARWTA